MKEYISRIKDFCKSNKLIKANSLNKENILFSNGF